MSVISRLALFYFILLSAALIYAWNLFYDDIRPSFRQISEESMVDTANLMAEVIAPLMATPSPDFGALEQTVKRFHLRNPQATIWSYEKTSTNLQFYITDHTGTVLYHSEQPSDVGEDYSQWRDINRALQGKYGARTSRRDADDPESGQMYVAAPIWGETQLLGIFTLIKPHQSILPFIGAAEYQLSAAGLMLLAVLMLSGLALVRWYKHMLDQLTLYIRRVRAGQKARQPRFAEQGFSELSDALQQLRAELDGKLYVENYTQTLTHELKSPLAAINAAAELLQTDLSEAKRQRFLANIEAEAGRMQQVIDQLLLLASLENRQASDSTRLDPAELLQRAMQSIETRVETKELHIDTQRAELNGAYLQGDAFLLGTALGNLLGNAVEFCPQGGRFSLHTRRLQQGEQLMLEIRVTNAGAHIPDYAVPRLFERFFSTARPDTQRKSSGLGLCVVEQICELHGGSIALSNVQLQGQSAVEALMLLPLEN